jgi:hypothetical protein
MGVVLGAHAAKLDELSATTRATQRTSLVGVDAGKLGKETKELEQRVEAVRKFAESRISWASYTSDLAARLPSTARLTALVGKNALETGKSKGASGLFQVDGMAPLLPDGSIPREIDAFLSKVPGDPLWKRDFATVTTDITLPLSKKESPEVDFSIACQRKAKGKGGDPKGADKDKKDK